MKLYIVTDLEGVSGVVEFEDRKDESPRNIALRQKYSRLLAGEVNAAIAGAFDAGVTEILVNECHGGCYTIDFELLDPRVRVLHGRARRGLFGGLDASYDAIFSIGAHAMAGTRGGVLFHTMGCSVREIAINGLPLGEIGIEAFCGGAYNVPLIYVSGDTAACREAEALIPNITTVAVKEGISRFAAIAHPPATACAMIREGARRAIENRATVRPFTLPPPYIYRCDVFVDSDGRARSAADPSELPGQWETRPEIHAETALELSKKVWGG